MNLQLKQIRQSKGFSQDEMASKLSELMCQEIKVSRYGTWERGDRMMNLEQAYYCAVALGVTLNDLIGMKTEGTVTGDEKQLVNNYRKMEATEREKLMGVSESFVVAAEKNEARENGDVERAGATVKDG